jgi:surface antigen
LSDAQAIAVASDSIAFIDANDSNISKKESIVDFIAAIAGGGLSANAGVLSTQGGVATAIGDVATATLAEGMNYGSATLGQNSVWSLPATPSVGDIVHAKAPANLGGFTLKIARQGTHTIDGVLELSLETAQAAVTVMYVAANTWVLF